MKDKLNLILVLLFLLCLVGHLEEVEVALHAARADLLGLRMSDPWLNTRSTEAELESDVLCLRNRVTQDSRNSSEKIIGESSVLPLSGILNQLLAFSPTFFTRISSCCPSSMANCIYDSNV